VPSRHPDPPSPGRWVCRIHWRRRSHTHIPESWRLDVSEAFGVTVGVYVAVGVGDGVLVGLHKSPFDCTALTGVHISQSIGVPIGVKVTHQAVNASLSPGPPPIARTPRGGFSIGRVRNPSPDKCIHCRGTEQPAMPCTRDHPVFWYRHMLLSAYPAKRSREAAKPVPRHCRDSRLRCIHTVCRSGSVCVGTGIAGSQPLWRTSPRAIARARWELL
jgi:hypothetical protein